MQELERLVREWPSWIHAALFVYAFVKTGPLPLFAGYASTLGWLEPFAALSAVWSGAIAGDLLRFELGRRFGPAVLRRMPTWLPLGNAFSLVLARHVVWVCLLKRFAKGLRTPISLGYGLSNLGRRRFVAITVVSAGVWSGTLIALGVFAGALVAQAPGPWFAVLGLVLMAALSLGLTWLVHGELKRVVGAPAATRESACLRAGDRVDDAVDRRTNAKAGPVGQDVPSGVDDHQVQLRHDHRTLAAEP